MKRFAKADYERYVAAFNARDDEALHAFFADDVVLDTLGYALEGKDSIRRFYGFFHDHVRETVVLRHFGESAEHAVSFADVTIRFEGLKDLTQEVLDQRGYGRMTPVPKGLAVEVDFLIRYEFDARGIYRIGCAVLERPAETR